MPRRGRHRTTLPVRLIAAIAALLVTGGIAVAAGSAAAKSGSGSGSILSSLSGSSKNSRGKDSGSDSDKSDGKDSKKSGKDSDKSGKNGKDSDNGSGKDSGKDSGKNSAQAVDDKSGDSGEGETSKDKNEQKKKDQDKKNAKKDEFEGRDKIKPASADDFVDITDVKSNGGNIGDGGVFGGGTFTENCGVSDHNNSDNYMAAPGKRNGAQHVHDYVGNRTTNANTEPGTLDGDPTSCGNGDDSTFFWPVLRDLNGTGPDVGKDGGSKDGNVGSILQPTSADLTFHGHPGQKSKPLPHGLMMIMGNAKAKVQDGDNANAKYTCTGFGDRVTDKYPICPAGSHLQRILDFPSCWDGKNLESKDFRQHIKFPNDNGQCDSDSVAVPQLRITLTYNQPAGRAFSIDTFPDNQHDPSTDHSDYENAMREGQADQAADCINAGQRCRT